MVGVAVVVVNLDKFLGNLEEGEVVVAEGKVVVDNNLPVVADFDSRTGTAAD